MTPEQLENNEVIISKIKKLLALSTSDNANEAAVAAAKAQTLLIEYNISQDELEQFNDVKSEKVIEVKADGKNKQRRSVWYDNLAYTVAKANLCNLLISGSGVIWIGKKTNIEVAQYIFDNLVHDLTNICDQAKLDPTAYPDVHGKIWKNNFYHGANQSIRERLNANLVQLKAADSVRALVVRNDIELNEYMKVKYPRLTHVGYSLNYNRTGFSEGKTAGRSVQFRAGIGAGGSSGPKLLNKG
jgi:DNA-binding transcriptional MerR regulator